MYAAFSIIIHACFCKIYQNAFNNRLFKGIVYPQTKLAVMFKTCMKLPKVVLFIVLKKEKIIFGIEYIRNS